MINRLYAVLAVIGAALATLSLGYLRGRGDQRAAERAADNESYIYTRKRIDEAPVTDDAAAARDRLRDFP